MSALRKKRIKELSDFAVRYFDAILKEADKRMAEYGCRPALPEESEKINTRNMGYPRIYGYIRPYGDFFFAVVERAEKDYYVIEATARSYANLALEPLETELKNRKYIGPY